MAEPTADSSTPSWLSKSSRASIPRSACWWTSRTHSSSTHCFAGATTTIRQRYLPVLSTRTVGAYALSEAGSGSDAFGLTTRARKDGDGYVHHRPQALDHQRQRGGPVHRVRHHRPGCRLPRHHGVPRRARLRRVHGRQERRQARDSSEQHLRADPGGLPGAVGERAGRASARATRSRSRRSTKDGSASARRCSAWPAGRSITPSPTPASVNSSEKPSPSSRPCSTSSRAPRSTSSARELAVYNAARLRDAGLPFLTEAAICKILSSEVAERVASLAVNLFGGNGFVKEYPVEKLFRDAKIGQIYEGTSNLQLQTIAKQILS